MTIREIPEHVIQLVRDRGFLVMRRKSDLVPLNSSFTEDGLKWTANKLGRALYYKRAFISKGKLYFPDENLIGVRAKDITIEPFVPINHRTEDAQVAEHTWVRKALKLWELYR